MLHMVGLNIEYVDENVKYTTGSTIKINSTYTSSGDFGSCISYSPLKRGPKGTEITV